MWLPAIQKKKMKAINLNEEVSKIKNLFEYKIIAKMNSYNFILIKEKIELWISNSTLILMKCFSLVKEG